MEFPGSLVAATAWSFQTRELGKKGLNLPKITYSVPTYRHVSFIYMHTHICIYIDKENSESQNKYPIGILYKWLKKPNPEKEILAQWYVYLIAHPIFACDSLISSAH